MQKKTLDDYSIQELLELPVEQLLEVRQNTVEFLIQTLHPTGNNTGNDNDTSKI